MAGLIVSLSASLESFLDPERPVLMDLTICHRYHNTSKYDVVPRSSRSRELAGCASAERCRSKLRPSVADPLGVRQRSHDLTPTPDCGLAFDLDTSLHQSLQNTPLAFALALFRP
jgi:hypothetical protein